MDLKNSSSSLFESIFFEDGQAVSISVHDYQRAYSWELPQLGLFIQDLNKYLGSESYYFGHFIVERTDTKKDNSDKSELWEVVDGQQRLTTFVLFLLICRHYTEDDQLTSSAYSFIERFATVSYDRSGFDSIKRHLARYLSLKKSFKPQDPPKDSELMDGFGISANFTHSQRRMTLALLRFHHAFEKGELERVKIADYINVIMQAHCSCHVTDDKSVAVNIFEMHNTRGVPLSTLEILKAKLMQFVYSKGGTQPDQDGKSERDRKVSKIQKEFGEIYAMEEGLAKSSFRGEMTMDNLLRQHLRVIDDGSKKTAGDLNKPPSNSSAEDLIKYVDEKLADAELDYALKLASELKKSMCIIAEILPAWDKTDENSRLVGDAMILERQLSCEWFLLICRRMAKREGEIDGRVSHHVLGRWERLLFTRNFHNEYYNLKGNRDNFPKLFERIGSNESQVAEVLDDYLTSGFRPGRTDGLSGIVRDFLNNNKSNIINHAFHWHPWRSKMIYALYKYEAHKDSDVRNVMKNTISVEHILPQEWQWNWLNGVEKAEDLTSEQRDQKLREVSSYINGIGNLLLISCGENSSVGNEHPARKEYKFNQLAGSYKWHDGVRSRWEDSEQWGKLILERGEEIFRFIMQDLLQSTDTQNGNISEARPGNVLSS